MTEMRMTKRQANTYRGRLLKLAKFLRELPRNRFTYGYWVGEDWNGNKSLCGTRACAFGWATTIPLFRKLGLRMSSLSERPAFTVTIHKNLTREMSYDIDPTAEAGEVVFGLTSEETQFLFVPNSRWEDERAPISTATPKQVAKHIETFVKSWKPELEPVSTTY